MMKNTSRIKAITAGALGAALSLSALAVPAFAAEDSTEVQYTQAGSYTVIIPKTVELSASATTDANIEIAKDSTVADGNEVRVSVASGPDATGAVTLTHTDTTTTATTTMTAGSATAGTKVNDVVATYEGVGTAVTANTTIGTLHFSAVTASKVGTYTGTVTFGIKEYTSAGVEVNVNDWNDGGTIGGGEAVEVPGN